MNGPLLLMMDDSDCDNKTYAVANQDKIWKV